MRGALSDERTGLSFKIAAGPRQRSHIYRGHNLYFMSSIFTILHVGQLSWARFFVDTCYLQFYMLSLVYMYVQYIQGLA
jgi:hypothetical protein